MISRHNSEQRMKESPYNYAYFILNRDRAEVYRRIEDRVDKMIEDGLVDEVKSLLGSGISSSSLAMQGLGYKEIAGFLEGDYSLEDAIYKLKLNTRHFAKRQLTWFRREKDAIWLDYGDYADTDEMLSEIIKILKERDIV